MSFYVFDLSGMVHRAFHGQPDNAARLAVGWAARILDRYNATHAAAAIDLPAPTFRHRLAPDTYKAKGRAVGEERALIVAQLQRAEQLFEDVLGVSTFGVAGFEGDDVVATLSSLGVAEGLPVRIVARDKDFCQLVTDDGAVNLFDFATDELITWVDVLGRHKISPLQFVDYLSMVGDSSDNVAGVWGVGPTSALKVLLAFGSLEDALVAAEAGPGAHPFWKANGKIWSRIAGARSAVELARTLVTLCADVPLKLRSMDDLRVAPVPIELLG